MLYLETCILCSGKLGKPNGNVVFLCVAYPSVWSEEKYLLISLLYPLARVTLCGGGAGWVVFMEVAAGAQTERARNYIVNGAYVANFHSMTMTG